jgi:uncharacterized protein DUF4398
MRTLHTLTLLTVSLFVVGLNPLVERAQAQSLYPPAELRLAREELEKARLALDVQEYERARRLADQALEDARIAEVRAGTESAREAARDLRLSIETLRDAAARASVAYLPPYSPVELRSAREKLDEAQIALDARAYERARHLAENGLVDARVAEVRAETESARQAARDLRLSLESLRAEAARLAFLY